ncbi:protein NEDD1 [Phalaenopsis equestris]|uniref:protein NEDD1 n=1 Tax=Phalaenopsis equestris TaxID=78828 RepID=UPI0009E29F2E|nr:protein NEDD1 [Phalaenopsis equestris]XP_020599109.1 protein NEDD1 [Phalaenopsis equestris]
MHVWDTTGRAPKVSWLKQHSAPTTGIGFSPSSEKIIASVGLDKKLYTFDSAMRRPTSCIPYEAPFSSLSYSDDGNILAAGTNGGLVVFYDVRGKPQPFTILHAFNSSESVSSLCWQRLKPFIVNESNCTAETALLGGASEDSILMPDPRPFMAASSFSSANTVSSFNASLAAYTSGSISTTLTSSAEETPLRSSLWRGGSLAKLQAPRGNFNLKDDMDVFSPLVDVQPITPSLGSLWDDHDEEKKDSVLLDKKSLALPSTSRRFPFTDGDSDSHKISDWRSSIASKLDDTLASPLVSTPAASSKSESCFSPTPSEAWGGNGLPGKFTQNHQPSSMLSGQLPSNSLPSGLTFPVSQDISSLTSQFSMTSLTNPTSSSLNLQSKSVLNNEKLSTYFESSSAYHSTSASTSFGSRPVTSSSFELPGLVQYVLPRRSTAYVDRLSAASSLSDGINSATSSPKSKKTGAETREELLNSLISRQDVSTAIANGSLPAINGTSAQHTRASIQPMDQLGSSSFSLQLVQRTLEETLGSLQKSIHDDVKNLHIDLLRQFHMQEMVMSNLINSVLEKQDELIKEVQTLRRENQQLRQLL